MTLDELKIAANCGIFGIDDDLNVFGGYDQQLDAASLQKPDWIDADEWHPLSTADRIALADRMIELWQRYKTRAQTPTP